MLVQGRILSVDGKPIKDAILNIWETAPNGLYEQQESKSARLQFTRPIPLRR